MDSYERHKAGQEADPSPDERDAPPTNLIGLANYCEHDFETGLDEGRRARCLHCELSEPQVVVLQQWALMRAAP